MNGKVYIGKTTKTLESRKQKHLSLMNNGSDYVFYRAMRKYGFNNFSWEVLDNANSETELNNKEIYWIKNLNSYIRTKNSNGYNMTLGGEGTAGRIVSKEAREKMRKSKTGENNHFFGKKLSDEHKRKIGDGNKGKFVSENTKNKISESQLGEKHWNYGGSISAEHKIAISNAVKGEKHPMYGKHHSETSIEKMKKSKTGISNVKRNRSVLQIDIKTGEILKEYVSLNDACKSVNEERSGNISKCCSGERKTAYGFLWLYKDLFSEEVLQKRLADINNRNTVKKSGTPVVQIRKDGKFLKRFESEYDGASHVNGVVASLLKCCKNILQTHKGYIWMYETDYQKHIEESIDILKDRFSGLKRNISVVLLDKNFNEIDRFDKVKDMFIEHGINYETVAKHCKNKGFLIYKDKYRIMELSDYICDLDFK